MKRAVTKAVPFLVAALICSVLASSQSSAATNTYPRHPRTFSGVELKTRGFLNNDCLAQLMYPCMSNAGGYRPEATAQARALQELSGLVPYMPALVSSQAETDSVQWEVAPPSPPCPDTADPGDTRGDDDAVTKPTTGPCWRVDVVRDYGASRGLFERKRWVGESTRNNVDGQIDSYVTRMGLYDGRLAASRDATLNDYAWSSTSSGWRLSYPDDVGNVWCVWADAVFPDPLLLLVRPGNIYFAPLDTTPQPVRDATPGCDPDTQEKTRQRYREIKEQSESASVPKTIWVPLAITGVISLFMATRPPPSVPPDTKPLPPVILPEPEEVLC